MASKLEKLVQFYAGVLQDVGPFDTTGDGLLSYKQGDSVLPVTIDKKRLCLPVNGVLKNPDWNTMIAFHPFSEEITQGPSPVLSAYKLYTQVRLSDTLKVVATGLLELAVGVANHKKLPAKLSKYMDALGDADDKCVDTLVKLMNSVTDAPERRLVSIMLKNGGSADVLRTAQVDFPLLDDLSSEDTTQIAGIKMPRKTKDKQAIRAVFEFILGDDEGRKQFTVGSADDNAPYFHALLLANAKLSRRLSQLIDDYEKFIPSLSAYKFNLDWAEIVEDAEVFNQFGIVNGAAVPPLPGNRGKEKDSLKESDSSKVYATNAGLTETEDLPFDMDGPHDPRAERTSRSDRNTRDERPAASDRGKGGLSLSELLRGKRGGGDRNERSERDSSRDRDRDRDRGRDRDRSRSRGGRSSW